MLEVADFPQHVRPAINATELLSASATPLSIGDPNRGRVFGLSFGGSITAFAEWCQTNKLLPTNQTPPNYISKRKRQLADYDDMIVRGEKLPSNIRNRAEEIRRFIDALSKHPVLSCGDSTFPIMSVFPLGMDISVSEKQVVSLYDKNTEGAAFEVTASAIEASDKFAALGVKEVTAFFCRTDSGEMGLYGLILTFQPRYGIDASVKKNRASLVRGWDQRGHCISYPSRDSKNGDSFMDWLGREGTEETGAQLVARRKQLDALLYRLTGRPFVGNRLAIWPQGPVLITASGYGSDEDMSSLFYCSPTLCDGLLRTQKTSLDEFVVRARQDAASRKQQTAEDLKEL